jgi:two-component system, sensor histidine kinase and response regulator
LINNCAQLLEANAENKDISISINIDDKIEALCDEVTIHTVFRNLISNAIKFTKNNGTISIEGKKTEDKVTITVQDSGIGMSAEAIENIFEKNQHYTSNGTANEQGTGLGLMLVKDFIRMNKGSIRVESTIGVGTTFFIELPV